MEDTPPRSKEGRARSVRLASGEAQMMHYAQTWLPLLSFALIAAVVFFLASFIGGGAEL